MCNEWIIDHLPKIRYHTTVCKNKSKVQAITDFMEERDPNLLLIDFIVHTNTTFRACESKEFKKLLNPKLKISNMKKIKSLIIDEGSKIINTIANKSDDLCLIMDEYKNIRNESIYNLAIKSEINITFLE